MEYLPMAVVPVPMTVVPVPVVPVPMTVVPVPMTVVVPATVVPLQPLASVPGTAYAFALALDAVLERSRHVILVCRRLPQASLGLQESYASPCRLLCLSATPARTLSASFFPSFSGTGLHT
jgi:hypothetical protein